MEINLKHILDMNIVDEPYTISDLLAEKFGGDSSNYIISPAINLDDPDDMSGELIMHTDKSITENDIIETINEFKNGKKSLPKIKQEIKVKSAMLLDLKYEVIAGNDKLIPEVDVIKQELSELENELVRRTSGL